jgi:hypothetical protein
MFWILSGLRALHGLFILFDSVGFGINSADFSIYSACFRINSADYLMDSACFWINSAKQLQ